MKIYFDNLDPTSANLKELAISPTGVDFWVTANGTILKKTLTFLNHSLEIVNNVNEPGCYFIDVNCDPQWWCGLTKEYGTPKVHVLNGLPEHILELVRSKKLRIIIAADREGGCMINDSFDCFLKTTSVMKKKQMPAGSVLIMQGNQKIEKQYANWLKNTGNEKLFDVQYTCHFDKIFFNHNMPSKPIVSVSLEKATYDYNSLNRVYRSHRGAHCFYLANNNLLKNGIVSCNNIIDNDVIASKWCDVSEHDFNTVMKSHYPLFVDGNWADTNAANQYTSFIYENSLMSFITETKFDEDVVFLTEKIFKPLALGHPLILLSSPGTLRFLEELGFRINWCGIDPSYNDIVDHKERFIETHNILKKWVDTPTDQKLKLILDSMDVIQHNFELIQNNNLYLSHLTKALNSSQDYFND
jgi:hypothetical protein